MAPRIDEPVQLAQFASSSKRSAVYVSRDTPNQDTLTIAVQDVGIHSVVSSATKDGPGAFASGFRFYSPAVTVIHSDQQQCTYAAASPQDGKKSQEGRVLGAWSRPVEETLEAPTYSQLKLDARISRIHCSPALMDRIVVVHENGKVSLVSSELNILATARPRSVGTVLESWLFLASACTFISSAVGEVVALLLAQVEDVARVSLVVVSAEDSLGVVGDVELTGMVASSIASVSCSAAGYLSVLQSNGLCTTFTLSASTSSSLSATPLPAPLHFQNLVISANSSSPGLPSSPLALHAVGGSVLVLAGVTVAAPNKLALLMWDVQYSTLLAERTFPLPTAISSPSDVNISLSGSTSTHLTISISSYVFGASIALPRTSSIASALGAARSAAHWLAPTTLAQDDARTALVERIRRDVLAGRAAQADAAFFRWVEDEAEEVSKPQGSAQGTLASATKAAAKIPFPSAFAAALVGAAFPPENSGVEAKDGPAFASGVVAALIWRGAAGQGMVGGSGGLYGALRRKRDWPIMLSALQHVPDIPEDEIIATIKDLLIPLHSDPSSTPTDPTQTPLTNPPTLQNGLAHIIAYPTSPAPLRLALRAHLCDAEDLVHVLKVLDAWLKRGLQFDVWELDGLQGTQRTGKNVGVSAGTGRKKIKGAGLLPALEHILTFTQALLDTHLLALLQHRPAHALIRSISANLSPLPAHNDALQTLAAPLAPFAAEDAIERKTESKPSAGNAGAGQGGWLAKEEWRKKRRAQFAAEAIAIGEYRFEELVL
ncbi:hypothetical protein BDV93DRAFT_606735 [Ceratobasidium sp. AG-I]|nr:hypothetical protein BDV93DRAFT_606735 [Ceratobasidium sp. AG-I]